MKKSRDEELLAFRRWVANLTFMEWIEALEFEIQGGVNCEDYGLLKELVNSQSPPPTPIHPAAMGYKPWCTAMGANDGRSEEDRVLRNRFRSPRLFKLYERGRNKYSVLARRKVTEAGDILGLGTTQHQRNADESILRGTLLYANGRCGFRQDLLSTPEALRDMLFVVSRGNFCSICLSNTGKDLWAPWLKPIETWFSLPKYLASKFEMALWSTFRGRAKAANATCTPLRDMMVQLSASPFERQQLMCRAIAAALKETLQEDSTNLPLLLDGILQNVLDRWQSINNLLASHEPDYLDSISLLQLGTFREKFCVLLRRNMEEQLLIQMQNELFALDEITPPRPKKSGGSPPKRKKNKKKKKKKRAEILVRHDVEVDVKEDQDESEEETILSPAPSSAPPSMAQTRKTLIVLSVIEDIVQNVFHRVGLINAQVAARPKSIIRNNGITEDEEIDAEAADEPPDTYLLGGLSGREIPAHSVHRGAGIPLEADLQVFGHHTPNLHELPWDFDQTNFIKFPGRDRSVLADFFLQDDTIRKEDDMQKIASSTAVSVASEKEPDAVDDVIELSEEVNFHEQLETPRTSRLVKAISCDDVATLSSMEFGGLSNSPTSYNVRSPSPTAPKTPPPQLSPILLSLDDIKDMKEKNPDLRSNSFSAIVAGSLPSSPIQATTNTLGASRSREDLRISTDDQNVRKRSGSVRNRSGSSMSLEATALDERQYRDTTISKPGKRNGRYTFGRESVVPVRGLSIPALDPGGPKRKQDCCAHSETAVEAHSEEHAWTNYHHEHAHVSNITTTKDESTTISALSPREPEEVSSLREERNTFRDMCLTLGAEVATLKNLLAAQSGDHFYRAHNYLEPSAAYNQEYMQHNFHAITRATTTIGAMSDAGIHRENDSAFSEDGTEHHDSHGKPRSVFVGSEMSFDQNVIPQAMPSFRPVSNDPLDLVSSCPSRLTTDIVNFLHSNREQVQKQERRIQQAVQRLERLTTAVWPRAQVKLYGSHVTGLCLPSSDLDFVIGLPAVHKNAPAITPGALEGRNAVNESSQKLLARRMKGEPWLDPRSIKIIGRTIVPVIKVSTKDTRANTLQLDISFDGPVHHGLEAVDMVNDILQDLPMVRPLLLVLKQFLIGRGLLTAYTGGLSSYCLFLMVTRYLQEQPSSWGDCGSLLMGFLDFYGNSFDPRATGISVGRSQYFPRRAIMPHPAPYQPAPLVAQIPSSPAASGTGRRPDFLRRHSFTEKANMMPDTQHNWSHRPPRPLPGTPTTRFAPFPTPAPTTGHHHHHGEKPYTFDPLWVEDPLSRGNNVGRNAFRISSVQRAFSDAHRALVASLEWDHSEDKDEYPLLKCLLQNQEVSYDLDDQHR